MKSYIKSLMILLIGSGLTIALWYFFFYNRSPYSLDDQMAQVLIAPILGLVVGSTLLASFYIMRIPSKKHLRKEG